MRLHRKLIDPFLLLILFIAAVSVHDAALVVLNCEFILEFEKNPLGRLLIEFNSGSVWLFVAIKILCTAMVCTLLASICTHSRRFAFAIAGPVAIFQAGLLTYLCSN